jgi:biopolymer transport protein ExbD
VGVPAGGDEDDTTVTRKTTGPATVENDMTPMIDVTFQLITFFMFVLNFSEAEQDERIQLPASQLAKPAEGVLETPITMQLTATGGVLYAGEVVPVDQITTPLRREREIIVAAGKDPKQATVIVRADGRASTGDVQQVIRACQEEGFERFALRAHYEPE